MGELIDGRILFHPRTFMLVLRKSRPALEYLILFLLAFALKLYWEHFSGPLWIAWPWLKTMQNTWTGGLEVQYTPCVMPLVLVAAVTGAGMLRLRRFVSSIEGAPVSAVELYSVIAKVTLWPYIAAFILWAAADLTCQALIDVNSPLLFERSQSDFLLPRETHLYAYMLIYQAWLLGALIVHVSVLVLGSGSRAIWTLAVAAAASGAIWWAYVSDFARMWTVLFCWRIFDGGVYGLAFDRCDWYVPAIGGFLLVAAGSMLVAAAVVRTGPLVRHEMRPAGVALGLLKRLAPRAVVFAVVMAAVGLALTLSSPEPRLTADTAFPSRAQESLNAYWDKYGESYTDVALLGDDDGPGVFLFSTFYPAVWHLNISDFTVSTICYNDLPEGEGASLTGFGPGPFAVYLDGGLLRVLTEEGVETVDYERIFSKADLQKDRIFCPFFAWSSGNRLSIVLLQGAAIPGNPDSKLNYYSLDLRTGKLDRVDDVRLWSGHLTRGHSAGLATDGDRSWVLNNTGWVLEWTPVPGWERAPSRRGPLDRLFGQWRGSPGTLMSNFRGNESKSFCLAPDGRIYVSDLWKGTVVSFLPGEKPRFEARIPALYRETSLGTPQRLLFPQERTGVRLGNSYLRPPMAVDAEENLYIWLGGRLYRFAPSG